MFNAKPRRCFAGCQTGTAERHVGAHRGISVFFLLFFGVFLAETETVSQQEVVLINQLFHSGCCVTCI